VRKSFRGWEFDEMEGKSTATKKPNSYPSFTPSGSRGFREFGFQ